MTLHETHIHIIGGTGQMGSWLRKFLEQQGLAVTTSSRSEENTTAIKQADIVFTAVPISIAPAVIEKISQTAAKEALLVDLSSLMTHATQALGQIKQGSMGLHFLFGPSITQLTNQKIVVIPVRDHPLREPLLNLFTTAGAQVIELTSEQHDRYMALIQALTHFQNLMLAWALQEENLTPPLQLSTPTFLTQFAVLTRVLTGNSAELLTEIQLQNPLFPPLLKRVIEKEQQLLTILANHDKERLEDTYEQIKTYIPRPLQKDEQNEPLSREKRTIDEPVSVAFLGPEGTFSHLAVQNIAKDPTSLIPCKTIPDIFQAVAEEKADRGVVPAENSTEGTIRETLDLLVEYDLKTQFSSDLPVQQNLLSGETELTKIRTVISHPQALAQCRQWLKKHLPQATIQATASTLAGAVEARKKPGVAIIGPALAAPLYDLHVISEDIEDNPSNITKFYVITKNLPTVAALNTLLYLTIVNRVGILRDILSVFADFNINLNKIESRPSKEKTWDYVFFIEVAAPADSTQLNNALTLLRQYCNSITLLGGVS